MIMMSHAQLLENVTNREQVYECFVHPVPDVWAHISPRPYLEAVIDVARNIEAICEAEGLKVPEEPTWGEFALILLLAEQRCFDVTEG